MSDTFDYTKNRAIKFPSVVRLQRKIDAYFISCFDYQRDMYGNRIVDKEHPKNKDGNKVFVMKQVKPFTVSGLAVFLDTSRQTLVNYEKGQFLPENMPPELKQQYFDTIKKAKDQIYAFTEEQLFKPGTATGAIFSLKNNWSDEWRDRQEIDSNETITVVSKNYRELEPPPDKPEPIEGEVVKEPQINANNPAV